MSEMLRRMVAVELFLPLLLLRRRAALKVALASVAAAAAASAVDSEVGPVSTNPESIAALKLAITGNWPRTREFIEQSSGL